MKSFINMKQTEIFLWKRERAETERQAERETQRERENVG